MSDPSPVPYNRLRHLIQQLLIRYVPPAELTSTKDKLISQCRRVLAEAPPFEMPPFDAYEP